jgi:hypothetical protein
VPSGRVSGTAWRHSGPTSAVGRLRHQADLNQEQGHSQEPVYETIDFVGRHRQEPVHGTKGIAESHRQEPVHETIGFIEESMGKSPSKPVLMTIASLKGTPVKVGSCDFMVPSTSFEGGVRVGSQPGVEEHNILVKAMTVTNPEMGTALSTIYVE